MSSAPHAPRKPCVLLVEDDASLRFGLAATLRAKGHDVVEASGCRDARAALERVRPDVVLLDLQLADGEAFDLLPAFRAIDPSLAVYIITGHGTIGTAVRAVKEGAEDFLTKPVSQSDVLALVAKALARRPASGGPPSRGDAVPSTSPAMRDLEAQVELLRNADSTVLILGETGTGKSVLARRIHTIGARAQGAFVDVNCAGLTSELAESELFGHERGAFTGAHAPKPGLFEAADGGTLFLDELGDIDAQVQPKILKAIEEKRFRRMGSLKERTADVRLVAATHKDLLAAVERRTFRADLYYRISTVTLVVPPLRERRGDLLAIARDLLGRLAGDVPLELSREAEAKLLEHPWPGNIRELKNVVERAVLHRRGTLVDGDAIRFDAPRATPPSREPAAVVPAAVVPVNELPASSSRLLAADALGATREELEREHIRVALEAEGGKVEAAAKRLGIPRSTLYWKLKQFGMAAGVRARARGDKPAPDDDT